MPTLTITTTYDDGTTLTEAQLDAIKSATEIFFNTTKLNSDNLATGAITDDELANSLVTAAKLGSSAVTTAKIADLSVTGAKIATNAITRAKRGYTRNIQVSSSCGTVATVFGALELANITNLSVTITTNGRPVFLKLIGGASEPNGELQVLEVTTLRFTRDGSAISEFLLGNGSGSQVQAGVGGINYIDVVAAGTYTYRLQGPMTSQSPTTYGNISMRGVKLLAYEL